MSDPVYGRGYHAWRHAGLLEDEEYYRARADASARLYLTPAERNSRVFEFGCGVGQGIFALPDAAGWDVSEEAREACRKRGVRVFDRLEDAPRSAWDIVLCRHVLEHVEEPLSALRSMRGLLAPGGHLFLILPKEGHRGVSLDPDPNQHLYAWNFRTLNNLLHRAGWVPYENREFHVLGYRTLLPLRRWAGTRAYLAALQVTGRAFRNAELIARARVAPA